MKDGYVEWPAPGVSATPLQVAGRCYSWRDGVWKETDASESISPEPPMRVFRFRNAAWRCKKDARYCSVALAPRCDQNPTGSILNINLSIAANDLDANETVALFDTTPPAAVLVCNWIEWFDLTIAAAAHEYLTAAMAIRHSKSDMATYTLRKKRMMLGAVQEMTECAMYRDLVDFGGLAYGADGRSHDPALFRYLGHVKTDIAARLRGERGTVALPHVHA